MNVQCRISVKISARLAIINMYAILPELTHSQGRILFQLSGQRPDNTTNRLD